ncbi:hypothetical protein VB713_27335 [Anabaena cylindrica UHCC 0172]|uniref:hypothetical protein n=1 Tax=Anabaena cylindrica TaxID=1165 RepID=UPI002B20714B|nr:hypothetical protein [Anabaena cylindrica]MEA5554645.1 hypothetical protein [Anabaena cylindrica UHCC 0172]
MVKFIAVLGMWECDRCFRVWECDRCLGCGSAIVFGDVGVRSLFGMWGCDRCISKHLTYQLI